MRIWYLEQARCGAVNTGGILDLVGVDLARVRWLVFLDVRVDCGKLGAPCGDRWRMVARWKVDRFLALFT